MQGCKNSLIRYIVEWAWIDDAAFRSRLFIFNYIYSYRLEKNEVTAEQGLEIFKIHCQNFAIIMANGIRKVRQEVDIFDKQSLDSCKIHLGQILVSCKTYILMITQRTRFNQKN